MYTKLIIGFIVLLITIIVSGKKNWNFGICAFIGAFIYNCFILNQTTNDLLAQYPSRQVVLFITTGAAFSFGAFNGTYSKLADNILYKLGGRTALVPWVCFAVGFLMGSSAASAMVNVIITAKISYMLWEKTRFNVLLCPCAATIGTVTGGYGFWTADAQLRYAYIFGCLGDKAVSATYQIMIMGWIGGILIFGLFYCIFKGWKNEANQKVIEVPKPEPYTVQQKRTLYLMLSAMLLLIVPALVEVFVSTPVTAWMTAKFDINVAAVLVLIAGALLGVGDVKEAVKHINWGAILILSGSVCLIGLIVSQGFTELITNFVQSGVPMWIVPPVFAVIAGLISIFATGSIGYAMLAPLIGALSGAGVSYNAMLAGIFLPPNMTGISPFSGGGSLSLAQCPDAELRENVLVRKQFALAFAICGLWALYSILIGLLF